MERLQSTSSLIVSQKKEWGEILTSFETKNKYEISDADSQSIYLAAEDGGSMLLRWFLKGLRPFTMVVLGQDGREVLRAIRPFRFYFHQIEVVDAQGISLGSIERRFAFLRRKYSVLDPTGNEIYQLFGPILHPWTFRIMSDETEHGQITKKWSGLLKESFTDADNFGVVYPQHWSIKLKALFLGAVFLIDFVHFENKGNS